MANIFIKTYGCTSNYSDSEELAREFRAKGFQAYAQRFGSDKTAFRDGREEDYARRCSLFIVNTCTISGDSERLLQAGFAAQARRLRPDAKIIFMGCSVKNDLSSIRGEASSDHFEARRSDVTALVERLAPGLGRDPPAQPPALEHPEVIEILVKRACVKFCSFCACGHALFRESECVPAAEIMRRLAAAWAEGYRTVVPAGPCIGDWKDPSRPDFGFADLVEKILSETDFRIGYLEFHPSDVSDKMIRLLASPRLSKEEVSVPIESASDAVLARMRRGYTRAALRGLFRRIYKEVPCIQITTDVIVGFPTETDRDARATLKFLREFPFHRVDVYPYSARPGTPAALLPALAESAFQRHWSMFAQDEGLRGRVNLLFDPEELRSRPPR